MRSETTLPTDMWGEFIERDLDLLIDGEQPFNDYLAPLESFVSSLSNFGAITPSQEFLEYHAAEAAASTQATRSAVTGTELAPRRRLAVRLKRRVAAGATSLMMIVGMTGVAWASDSAVPGDWNYGIDRALEALGIGAGGAAERLQELAAIRENGHPSGAESAPQTGPVAPPDVVGLENAAATVAEITEGSHRASDVRTSVSILLAYLADTDAADGPTISELAQQFKQAHQLSRSNRPEVNPGEQHRPDLPGAAESGKAASTGH